MKINSAKFDQLVSQLQLSWLKQLKESSQKFKIDNKINQTMIVV